MKYIYSLLAIATLSCSHVYAQSAFDADKVSFQEVYDGSLIEMQLLGKNKNGIQLWYHKGVIKDPKWPRLKVEGAGLYALNWVNHNFHSNTDGLDMYSQEDPEESDCLGVTGNDIGHYISVLSECNVYYGAYDESANEWKRQIGGADYYKLVPQTFLKASDPVYDTADGVYKQTLKWHLDSVADFTLSRMIIRYSDDGGKSWTTTRVYADNVKVCDSAVISVPRQCEQIRYLVQFSNKDKFNMLFDNQSGLTSNQTKDFKLQHLDFPCELKVNQAEADFSDAEEIYERKCQPTVTWNISDNYKNDFQSAELQYSLLDDDGEWHTLLTTDQTSGSQKVDVPVGVSLYRYRMVIKPKTDRHQMCDSTVVVTECKKSYSPTYNSLELKSALSDSYNSATNMLAPTLAYDLSGDLYQTRIGKTTVSYSTDDGKTWTLAATVDSLKQKGEAELSIPAEETDYLFRMNMACSINGVITTSKSLDTQAYAFKKQEDPKPEVKTITLKDSEAYTAQTLTSGNVTVTRSFVSGRMGTVCLPFALTSAQIAEGFGENAEVYEYTELKENAMNFKKVTKMEAGKAYLVKTAEDKSSISFTGVNISEDAAAQPSTVDGNYVFTGTFSPYTMKTDQTEYFLATNGSLKYPSSSSDNANLLGGYRGYFRLAKDSNAKICFDDEITGIDGIDIDDSEQVRVYNLNGQFVGSSLNGLPKGVYVANGKKIIIK